ncbi:hypothetical protein CEXT_714931 [Caerostris extrusa]|uniref:Ribosomal protein L16 n=1 Tax=Caerostris extrusa TaxID=172846 RepID=A0AAV4N4S9_CAEEX|nr:hypothetical protein CEXT_714931 [Caerostris extrusa]
MFHPRYREKPWEREPKKGAAHLFPPKPGGRLFHDGRMGYVSLFFKASNPSFGRFLFDASVVCPRRG